MKVVGRKSCPLEACQALLSSRKNLNGPRNVGRRDLKKKTDRAPRSVRTRALLVNNFVGQVETGISKDTFPQAMEYASLLGLQGRDSNLLQEQRIIASFEELSNSDLEKGYSKRVEEGRTVLLHAAVDGARRLRSMSQRSTVIMEEHTHAWIQWWLLPAAMSLLQETGQSDLVLELGTQAMERRECGPHKRDILLTMALAHCDLSGIAFEGKDQVALGCAHLEQALSLLEKAGFSPGMSKLASEIQEGLRALKPPCVIEHLKLPNLPENQKKRKQAISVLKSLLANPELAQKNDGSTAVDRKFVRDSLILLTSAESVNLLDWEDIAENGSTVPWYFDGLLERGGIAQITAGFTQRRPSLIEQGAKLLSKRRNADLLVEEVVAHVLLAETANACTLLLDSENKGHFKREATFTDALRDNNTSSSSGTGSLPEPGDDDVPARGDVLSFIRANSPDGDYDLVPGLCTFTERWLSSVAFPRFPDTADGQVSTSLSDYFENEKVTNYISVKSKESDSLTAGVLMLSDQLSNKLQQLRDAPLSTRNAKLHKKTELARLDLLDGVAASQQASVKPLWLHRVSTFRPAPRTVMAFAFGLATIVAATVVYRARSTANIPSSTASTSQSIESPTNSKQGVLGQWRALWQRQNSVPKLRSRTAESCIRRWQAAKALAMGPRHDDSLLSDAIVEPYLSTVRKDAASARKAGWFWSYRLSDLYIESVDDTALATDREGAAVVTARLRERGELFAVSGKRADQHCYDNSYRAEYRMTLTPEKTWKVSNVLVLGEE